MRKKESSGLNEETGGKMLMAPKGDICFLAKGDGESEHCELQHLPL